MSNGPNISFPFDGQAPDNLPVVGDPLPPDHSFNPLVELDARPLARFLENIDVSLDSLSDGTLISSLFDSE